MREALSQTTALPKRRGRVVQQHTAALQRKLGEAGHTRIRLGLQDGVASDPYVGDVRERGQASHFTYIRHEIVAQIQLREAMKALDTTYAFHAIVAQVEHTNMRQCLVDAQHAIDHILGHIERLKTQSILQSGRHSIEQVVTHIEVLERRQRSDRVGR